VSGWRIVRQSRFQARNKASCSVNCRCSTFSSSSGSASSASSRSKSPAETGAASWIGWEGFQVAPEGMAGPDSAGVVTIPSFSNRSSASCATAAIARARSSLNCLRSARLRAVTSSDVESILSRRLKLLLECEAQGRW
jgi:hypothetical protein